MIVVKVGEIGSVSLVNKAVPLKSGGRRLFSGAKFTGILPLTKAIHNGHRRKGIAHSTVLAHCWGVFWELRKFYDHLFVYFFSV